MDTPKSLKLEIIIPAYRMHSQIFLNALDGVSEEDALKRIDSQTNHIVWMAGNFVNVRYAMAHVLGLQENDPYHDLFFMGRTLDESYHYPSVQELKENFKAISPKVYAALLQVDDAKLAEIFTINMNIPFIEENKLNFIGMCVGREDYPAGQIALMRRLLHYPGMKYDVDEEIKY